LLKGGPQSAIESSVLAVLAPMKRTIPAVAMFDSYWAANLAFARSLGRQRVPLHFYGSGAGRWSRYCTLRRPCPPVENAAVFLPWLRDKLRSGEIVRVAPTTDLIAFYISSLRSDFAPEVQRTIAPLAEIENCLIKTRFSLVSGGEGESMLPTASADSLESAMTVASKLGYPLMLKPNSHLVVGFVERGAVVRSQEDLALHFVRYDAIRGQEELALAYPEVQWPLIQRYVPSARNRVYSVSGVKDVDGGVLSACVSYKREQWPPDVGVSTVQIGCENARILEFGLKIVDRVLSRGIFEIEVVADGENLYAIDLNPRAFGFIALDIARGSDLPWLWYRSTLQRMTPSPNAFHKSAIVARSSLLAIMGPLSKPRLRLTDGEEGRNLSVPRTVVSMLGYWSDPVPMIVNRLYELRHPRSFLRAHWPR
jgi:predicted ATP-grasp superfamily ATP-dependent carboligase